MDPDEKETVECVQAAIASANIDEIVYWMQQRSLFYSSKLAHVFEEACTQGGCLAPPSRCSCKRLVYFCLPCMHTCLCMYTALHVRSSVGLNHYDICAPV